MVTFSTWQLVGLVVALLVVYTVTLVVAAKVIGKGLSSKMFYLLPVYPMDTTKRIYAISRQLGVPVDDVSYMGKSLITGKSEYFIKGTEQVVTVEPFFGLVVKTSPDGDILTNEYHAYSGESISQQHNYLAQLKEQGLTPETQAQTTDTEGDDVEERLGEVEEPVNKKVGDKQQETGVEDEEAE